MQRRDTEAQVLSCSGNAMQRREPRARPSASSSHEFPSASASFSAFLPSFFFVAGEGRFHWVCRCQQQGVQADSAGGKRGDVGRVSRDRVYVARGVDFERQNAARMAGSVVCKL